MGTELDLGKTFDDAEKEVAEARSPVPAGIYQLRITDSEVKTSNKGGTYVAWAMEVFGSMDTPIANGKKIFHNTPVNGTDVAFLIDLVKATGARWEGTKFDPQSLIGKTLSANIKIEVYQEKEKNVIKSFC